MRTLAVIPARSGSKRIPDKNLRPFLGQALVHWSLEFARQCSQIDLVHLCTDSAEIAAVSTRQTVEVPFLRSAKSATDEASSVDAVIEVIERLEAAGQSFDLVALFQPTTPYRHRERWEEAFAMFSDPSVDSVVSAKTMQDHPWHGFTMDASSKVSHFFNDEKRSSRSQDLPPAMVINGSIYISKVEALRRDRAFGSGDCRAVICRDAAENIDIDTPDDWAEAEALLAGRLN